MNNTRVVILAAGKGTRMKSDVPKPLIPVAGEPMVTRLVRSVKESGVDEKPIVVVGAWSEALFREALKDSVDYAVQHEQLGTGHALMVAKESAGDATRIIVLYGDHPFLPASVIAGLVHIAAEHENAVAMLTATLPNFDGEFATFAKWGRVLRGADNEVAAIREAKDASAEELETREVSPGMYAFPAPWVWLQESRLRSENAAHEFYINDLIDLALAQGMHIVTSPARPLDVIGVNTPDELARAENAYTGGNR